MPSWIVVVFGSLVVRWWVWSAFSENVTKKLLPSEAGNRNKCTAQKIPYGSPAHEFSAHLHIHTDFPHIFFINKSCLNFNKIVFIETIAKKSLKNVRPKFKNARKIRCGQSLKKLWSAFVPIARRRFIPFSEIFSFYSHHL